MLPHLPAAVLHLLVASAAAFVVLPRTVGKVRPPLKQNYDRILVFSTSADQEKDAAAGTPKASSPSKHHNRMGDFLAQEWADLKNFTTTAQNSLLTDRAAATGEVEPSLSDAAQDREEDASDALVGKRRSRPIEQTTVEHLEGVTVRDALAPDTTGTPALSQGSNSRFVKDDNSSYVFLGDSETMLDLDPALRLLSSELAVWKHLRNEVPSKDKFLGLPVELLLERTWDTFEDIFVHLRRIPYEKGWTELSTEEEATRKTIVVLGSGWAAHALIKVADCNKLRLVVVSPSNHFVFTPMLASAAVGTVEYRSMTEAVRAANPMIHEYLEGKATHVDLAEKTVRVQLNSLLEHSDSRFKGKESESAPVLTLNYDHLVVAVGSKVDDRGVPGAGDKALRLKTTDDAKNLRKAVGECLEYASRPNVTDSERARRVTILIVGGGATGVELAGELHDLFEDVTRPHKGTYPKLANAVQVKLVHGGPDLVPQFEPALRAEALKALEKKGVEVILNTRVTEVGDEFASLSTKVLDPETGRPTGERKESTLPMGLAVWCAGTAPVSFVEKLLQQLPGEARHSDGRVNVDKWMRPPVMDGTELGSIFVLGDAAACREDGTGDLVNEVLLPATAQVAGQEGAYVARILDRNYDLSATPPKLRDLGADQTFLTGTNATGLDVFDDPAMNQWLRFRGLESAPAFGFLNLGMLAYLGGGEALTQVSLGNVPILAWAGSVAFVLWRSVYLVKQVATRNRVLVTFDWIKSAIFGRDTTRL